MKHTFIIIDDETESILKTLSVAARFQDLHFLASANSYEEGLNLILEYQPALVFLEINPKSEGSKLSLQLIGELHRYLEVVPKIIITTESKDLAYDALKYGAFDYLAKPVNSNDLRKLVLLYQKSLAKQRFAPLNQAGKEVIGQEFPSQEVPLIPKHIEKNIAEDVPEIRDNKADIVIAEEDLNEDLPDDSPVFEAQAKSLKNLVETHKAEKPLIICVKSYGDYRFIEAKDICYLQADNNSTDIHLFNGEMITAFKTLKHFENVLSFPFTRIHNSYIVNIDYVSRIHTGNSVCYIKNTTTKLPFSKSYKENVDAIINSITKGNYLEI